MSQTEFFLGFSEQLPTENNYYHSMLETKVSKSATVLDQLELVPSEDSSSNDWYLGQNKIKREGLHKAPVQSMQLVTEKDKTISVLKHELKQMQRRALNVRLEKRQLLKKLDKQIAITAKRDQQIETLIFENIKLQNDKNLLEFQLESLSNKNKELNDQLAALLSTQAQSNETYKEPITVHTEQAEDDTQIEIENWHLIEDYLPGKNGFYEVSDGLLLRTGYFSQNRAKFFIKGDVIRVKYWRESDTPIGIDD